MTSSSDSHGWNDDQLDDLLTRFYEQETPACLRYQISSQSEVSKSPTAQTSPPRKRRPMLHVVAALLVLASVSTWLWWPFKDSGRQTSDTNEQPTATGEQKTAPAETLRRTVPARLTGPQIAPSSDIPEWEIQVFPIDEEAFAPADQIPAVAEPSSRRLND